MRTNPNNCAACDHKMHPDGGWCYMFRNEPTDVCYQHTARYARLVQCDRICEGRPCGLKPPCPDCGPSLIG